MFFPALVSLLLLSTSVSVQARPCLAFDINWNLLAFGLDGKDWNAGTQDTWTGSGQAIDITTSGRPPFDAANTTCYLSQYTNAVYVLSGDSKNASSIYIYDASAKSWSTQAVETGLFDLDSYDAILDHDTNLFYALSLDHVWSLDMGLLKAANSTPLTWTDAEASPFPPTYPYRPVMALAQNHIHFLNAPGVPAGSAVIFLIHFAYFQSEPQPYPLPNGSAFPATYGQATSFFQANGVQQEFAFIPEDSSAVYVINVETNTTQVLTGPTVKDPGATYFASITALVQLSTNGTVSFLPYQEGQTDANAGARWSKVGVLLSAAPPSTSTPSSSATGTASGANATGTGSASGPGSTNAAATTKIHLGLVLSAFGAAAIVV